MFSFTERNSVTHPSSPPPHSQACEATLLSRTGKWGRTLSVFEEMLPLYNNPPNLPVTCFLESYTTRGLKQSPKNKYIQKKNTSDLRNLISARLHKYYLYQLFPK